MSRNAVAAMAVVLVSGFAGCAATSRAAEPATPAVVHAVPAPMTAWHAPALPVRAPRVAISVQISARGGG